MLTGPPPLGTAPDVPSRTPPASGCETPGSNLGPGCLWLEPRSAPPAHSPPSPPGTAVSSGLSGSPVSGGLCRLAGHR